MAWPMGANIFIQNIQFIRVSCYASVAAINCSGDLTEALSLPTTTLVPLGTLGRMPAYKYTNKHNTKIATIPSIFATTSVGWAPFDIQYAIRS